MRAIEEQNAMRLAATAARDRAIVKWHRQGLARAEIGRMLGCDQRTVTNVLRKLGAL